ncbi:MAG TPA: phage antirepressor KilAC domain-containing protein [Bacteroides clarus]|uniref:phage antirepressor KilAC domain-containing protein n=1 Tax=Bacteroides clarus TaxID=626929 RepID=UPI001E06F459|nr:phage antirepressor KilAC domain-containing protein [Bacteroides clarus]HJG00252.1 phage antirepressor KilAC domain-containing protein [Bacteroides clarus]
MENNLILSKESSESEIKHYFNAVLELSKSDNEFPINIDEVWMLVYSRRDYATDALKKDFIENVDYRCTSVKTEVGSTRIEYEISVSCMEFFIARKVRPVFEVYRQVFHKVAKHELSRKELALMVIQAEEEKERLLLENNHLSKTVELQTKELTQAAPKVNYYDNHLQSVNTQTSTQVAKQIGLDAEKLHKTLKEIGIIYRQSGQWILHAPYSTWGLHSTRTQTYTRSDGSTGTSVYTVWTTKGVRFIIALYENDWNVRKAIKQIKGELNPAA